MEPSIGNELSHNLKILKTITSFTHKCEKLVLEDLNNYVIIWIISFVIIVIIIILLLLLLLL